MKADPATSLPDALMIGPMKAGTTWLHEYLAVRGDVCLPRGVKETFFFDRHFGKGVRWYAAHFRHRRRDVHLRTMEVAPSYFHCGQAPERICEVLGPVPLLVTLRDPIRRSWSHYLHLRRLGYTRAPLQDAVRRYPEVIEASRYVDRLREWGQVFGPEHVHVFLYDDLTRDQSRFVAHACGILGLEYRGLAEGSDTRANESAVAPLPALAAMARHVAHALRSHRLHFVVNGAKRIGLKTMVLGRPGRRELMPLSDADHGWLAGQLHSQLIELQRMLRRDLSAWRG